MSSFLGGSVRLRPSLHLTSPTMTRRAEEEEQEEEEIPANLAYEEDDLDGFAVTEVTLVAQMATLRGLGLYSPVPRANIPTPSRRRHSLLSRIAEATPSRGIGFETERERSTTTALLKHTPDEETRRRPQALIENRRRESSEESPALRQNDDSRESNRRDEEESREGDLVDDLAASPEKCASNRIGESTQRDGDERLLSADGVDRCASPDGVPEVAAGEASSHRIVVGESNEGMKQNDRNHETRDKSPSTTIAVSRPPVDDENVGAPAVIQTPAAVGTPVAANTPDSRKEIPPVVLRAQPPPLPTPTPSSSIRPSSKEKVVSPSLSGPEATEPSRLVPVSTADAVSSVHGDDDALADAEAAAFDANADAREIQTNDDTDLHEGSSQSTNQFVETEEIATPSEGLLSRGKVVENAVSAAAAAAEASVAAHFTAANSSLRSTVEKIVSEADVASRAALASATTVSESAQRSAETAHHRTNVFVAERALSTAEDANAHAHSMSTNAINSTWNPVTLVVDQALATAESAYEFAQGMVAHASAQSVSCEALLRDVRSVSSPQRSTESNAVETPVDAHRSCEEVSLQAAQQSPKVVEGTNLFLLASHLAPASLESVNDQLLTSESGESLTTISELVHESMAKDVVGRPSTTLEVPVLTLNGPDDSDVNQQANSGPMEGEDDLLSQDSEQRGFEIGSRVRVKPINSNGVIAAVMINGWRRIKLDNGKDTDHRDFDLEYLDDVAEELEVLHPAEEFSVADILEPESRPVAEETTLRLDRFPPSSSQIIAGLRVACQPDDRLGEVTEPGAARGWVNVRFDGEKQAKSVRRSTLRIVLFEPQGLHKDLESDERRDDVAHKSRRVNAASPLVTVKAKPAAKQTLTSSRRRGVLSVGTRVAVLRKNRELNKGCGTIARVLQRGWRKIRFDGEESVSNVSFRVAMLEHIDPRADRAPGEVPTKRDTPGSEKMEFSVEKDENGFKNSFMVGDTVAVARGNTNKIGRKGIVKRIHSNGWRTVVLVGSKKELSFRPWQLDRVATEECAASVSTQHRADATHDEAADSSVTKKNLEKDGNGGVTFDVGERVRIVEDTKDPRCVGKVGIVLSVSGGGWRKIRRLYDTEARFYRVAHLQQAAAMVDTKKKSLSSSAERQVVIVDEKNKRCGLRGVVQEEKRGGWLKVFFDAGDVAFYRKIQVRDVENHVQHKDRFVNKPLKQQPSSSIEAPAMQVGDRVRVKEEFYHRLSGGVDDEVLGVGIVVGIGTAGQHRVILDSATEDGTTSICVPRDRLRVLDTNFAHDDVEESASPPQRAAGTPPYQHIDRMCFTASAKKVLSERAAKRSGMLRRISADDAEPPTCECISRRAWNMQIAKKLAERRCKRKAEKDGDSRHNRGAAEEEEVDDEENPVSTLSRAKKRRSCTAPDIDSSRGAPDDFELVFEDESEREFAIAEEKKKTIGVECDADCLNRQLCVECGASSCAHGDRCRNRQFERRQSKRVIVQETPHCGWGLVCGEAVRRGEFIIEALGELVAKEEAESRLRKAEARGDTNFYMIDCESSGNLVVDATRKGNESRFTNHSCDPSCELNKWRVGDTERYGLFAKRSLAVGEEITFNYRWKQATWHQPFQSQPCNCGAKTCAGFFNAMPSSSSQQGATSNGAKKPATSKRRRSRQDLAERRSDNNDDSAEEGRERKRARVDDENPTLPAAAVSLSLRLATAVRKAKDILFTGESDDLEDSTGLLWSKRKSSSHAVDLTRRLLREWSSVQGEQFGDDDDVVEPSSPNADADGPSSPMVLSDEEPVDPVGSGPEGAKVRDFGSVETHSSNIIFSQYFFSKKVTKRKPQLVDDVRGSRLDDVRDLLGAMKNEGLRKALLDVIDSVRPEATASGEDDEDPKITDDVNDPRSVVADNPGSSISS